MLVLMLVAAFALLDMGAGFGLMASKSQDESIYQLLRKNDADRTAGTTAEARFDPDMLNKAAANADLVTWGKSLI